MPPRSAPSCATIPRSRASAISASSRTGSRQADIYRRHCTGAGSTFSLYLKGGETRGLRLPRRAARSPSSRSASAAPRRWPARPAAMTHLSVPDERKAGARHHRQSGAHLDRRRGSRRPDRRLRPGAGGGLDAPRLRRGISRQSSRPPSLRSAASLTSAGMRRWRRPASSDQRWTGASETWSE